MKDTYVMIRRIYEEMCTKSVVASGVEVLPDVKRRS